MKVRLVDKGYHTMNSYQYLVQIKKYNLYWSTVNHTDHKDNAMEYFDRISSYVILQEKEV